MTLEQGGDTMETQEEPQASEPEQPAEAEDAAPAEVTANQAQEYLAALQRLKADFDNYRRRMTQEQARWADAAVAGFIVQLLPVIDNLERAVGAAGDGDAVRQGVELTVRQFRDVLTAAGVTAMEVVGAPFDPARHEAVARSAVQGLADGVVAQEYRRGYLFREQVLRPAMVLVASGEDPEAVSSRRDAAQGPGENDEAAQSRSGAPKEGER